MELSEHAPDTQTDLQLQNSLEKNARRKPTAQMCEAWLSWMSSMTPLWNRKPHLALVKCTFSNRSISYLTFVQYL